MVWIRTIIIVLTLGLVLIVGCTGSGERGFKSDRPEFMQQLRVALSQSGIPFREDAGYIFYDKEYKKAFDEVLIKVNESVSGGVSVRYEDAASRQYHKQLLREQGIKYLIEYKDGDEWIRWYPESDEQQAAIELKVAEKNFERGRGK